MTETDIAWAAGFVDGEGCVSQRAQFRSQNRRTYSLSIYVGQVDPRPLYRLSEYFGGNVALRTSWKGGRPIYMWRVTGAKAEWALRVLLPYLMVKAEQARLAIELQERIRAYVRVGRSVDPEETAARMVLVDAIKADKWRSHEAA